MCLYYESRIFSVRDSTFTESGFSLGTACRGRDRARKVPETWGGLRNLSPWFLAYAPLTRRSLHALGKTEIKKIFL